MVTFKELEPNWQPSGSKRKKQRAMSKFQVVEAPFEPEEEYVHKSPHYKIWLTILLLGAVSLLVYGIFYETIDKYQFIFISVGCVLLVCFLLFVSFIIFDRRELRRYTLHMLVTWFVVTCILLVSVLCAYFFDCIHISSFLILVIPAIGLVFYMFGEIFLHLERQRLRPLLLHERLLNRYTLQEIHDQRIV